MADDTIDPSANYLLLEADGSAIRLPGGDDFWQQLMSGNPHNPGVRRLIDSERGKLLSVMDMHADWTNWEMHPAGDEVLFMLQGRATFLFEQAGGNRRIELQAGHILIVPRGVWHTARIAAPCRLLAITQGMGTEHRPV